MRPDAVRNHRPILIAAKLGELTQGTIFSCARAERYCGRPVYGLVMTARCDIAQKKFPVLNYVPIVTLRDWLQADGLDLLIARHAADHDGKMKSELKQRGISPDILKSVAPDKITEAIASGSAGDKPDKRGAERFQHFAEQREAFLRICRDGNSLDTLNWITAKHEKSVKELIERLFKHDVTGYYFLERLAPGDVCTGYVCLLREMTAIPRALALGIARGLGPNLSDPSWRFNPGELLSFEVDDFAMPLAQVGSPTLEHVLQTFSTLFARIGLPDPNPEDLDAAVANATTHEGKQQ